MFQVGYEYKDCSLVWIAKATRVAGHDMTLSNIGGWNLDVHHKYNYHEGKSVRQRETQTETEIWEERERDRDIRI